MVEVIKQGKRYFFKCDEECGCEWTASKTDIIWGKANIEYTDENRPANYRKGTTYVAEVAKCGCPSCGKLAVVEAGKLETYTKL